MLIEPELQPLLREVRDERLGARIREHPAHVRFERLGIGEPAGDRVVAQRVVWDAVPEEQREPRGKRSAVVALLAAGDRALLLVTP